MYKLQTGGGVFETGRNMQSSQNHENELPNKEGKNISRQFREIKGSLQRRVTSEIQKNAGDALLQEGLCVLMYTKCYM